MSDWGYFCGIRDCTARATTVAKLYALPDLEQRDHVLFLCPTHSPGGTDV